MRMRVYEDAVATKRNGPIRRSLKNKQQKEHA